MMGDPDSVSSAPARFRLFRCEALELRAEHDSPPLGSRLSESETPIILAALALDASCRPSLKAKAVPGAKAGAGVGVGKRVRAAA